MTITTKNLRNKNVYVYNTDITNPHLGVRCGELRYEVSDSGNEESVDAKEYEHWGREASDNYIILLPLPGKEEEVRKFIALGNLKNPDFPFKLHPDSE